MEQVRNGYCNKCNDFIKDMNQNEKDEEDKEGSFICSDCINEEMNKFNTDCF